MLNCESPLLLSADLSQMSIRLTLVSFSIGPLACEIFSRHDRTMKKFALILAGCGHQDGTEITEAVSLLIALNSLGAQVQCFSPRMEFQGRNLLDESQRIARGSAKDLASLNSQEFDALIFPGGFGAAMHLCNWASRGASAEVHPLVKKQILDFHQSGKPIGAVCIAPVLLALTLGSKHITLTLGDEHEVIDQIQKTGAHHEICNVDDFISDRDHKIVTSPAYMYDKASPHEVFKGLEGLCREIFEMA